MVQLIVTSYNLKTPKEMVDDISNIHLVFIQSFKSQTDDFIDFY